MFLHVLVFMTCMQAINSNHCQIYCNISYLYTYTNSFEFTLHSHKHNGLYKILLSSILWNIAYFISTEYW